MSCPVATQTWKRAAIESHFLDTCTIREPGTPTRGIGGGVVSGTPVDTTNVACRIEAPTRSGDIFEVASRLQLVAPMVFYFATSQAISDLAQVISGGFTYNVKWVQPVTAKSTQKVVLVDKITAATV